MEINICVYHDHYTKAKQQITEIVSLRETLNKRAQKREHYSIGANPFRFSTLENILTHDNYDFCIFFTLNPAIVALIQQVPYMSHIVVLEDFSTCPALFAGWEQLPSPEGSQQWRPAAWEHRETTVLITTPERLVEDAFAFFKQEGLSFNP